MCHVRCSPGYGESLGACSFASSAWRPCSNIHAFAYGSLHAACGWWHSGRAQTHRTLWVSEEEISARRCSPPPRVGEQCHRCETRSAILMQDMRRFSCVPVAVPVLLTPLLSSWEHSIAEQHPFWMRCKVHLLAHCPSSRGWRSTCGSCGSAAVGITWARLEPQPSHQHRGCDLRCMRLSLVCRFQHSPKNCWCYRRTPPVPSRAPKQPGWAWTGAKRATHSARTPQAQQTQVPRPGRNKIPAKDSPRKTRPPPFPPRSTSSMVENYPQFESKVRSLLHAHPCKPWRGATASQPQPHHPM